MKLVETQRKRAVIIGAGPAGLTAAYQLLTRSDVLPVVLEQSPHMGGISRTVEYKGNRMDIGGHRFFSKSDRVMDWWLSHMPLQNQPSNAKVITYHRASRSLPDVAGSTHSGPVMLLRQRRSRIYFLRKFFAYPIQLSMQTLRNLGVSRTIKIGLSYVKAVLLPPRRIDNLEEFFISRFGRELYELFFKSYTEKVWGVACDRISAEWGAQRIKGLSVLSSLTHLAKKAFSSRRDLRQKNTETSLVEQFLYPELGPGQLWEIVADKVKAMGGTILTGHQVEAIHTDGDKVTGVVARDEAGGTRLISGDYFVSTMPIKDLVTALQPVAPPSVREISDRLEYRDFITVGLLVSKLTVQDPEDRDALIKDNWIYIQEPEVLAGRLQIFNNWSPSLVRDRDTVWLGIEYFCYDTEPIWKLPDAEMSALAARELHRIGIIDEADVLDSTVVRVPKTYPAYFGVYARFGEVRDYLDGIDNLFLVGRNGMHKYNNQDHSMLTAMTAVDNIIEGRIDKSNIWAVNTEMEYHEEKQQQRDVAPESTPVADAA
ncbi:MAG: NAD(P)/FAD-dependent oxidoreductase [Acidobacteriales bacterium]|nr:NAD(P)/FAD-dependent oxidoreductase [Terriglobales bacterium]